VRRSRRTAVLLAAAALAVGCGSSDDSDPEDEITNAVTDYYVALAQRDGEKACSLLTEMQRTRRDQDGGCEKAVADEDKNLMPSSLEAEDVEVVDIQVDGDSARAGARISARLTRPPEGPEERTLESITLKRVDGEWLIDETVG